MDLNAILKNTVEEAVVKNVREVVTAATENLIENLSAGINKQRYSLNDMLTEKQVAEYLELSVNTLRVWRIQKKYIPYMAVGERVVRYRFEDVLKFVVKNTVHVKY